MQSVLLNIWQAMHAVLVQLSSIQRGFGGSECNIMLWSDTENGCCTRRKYLIIHIDTFTYGWKITSIRQTVPYITLEPRYNAVFGVQAMVQRYKWGSVVG